MYACTYGGAGKFEWDERKAQASLRKHRVDFADAAIFFEDERAVTVAEDEVYATRAQRIRIISARRAAKHERTEYEQAS